MSSFKYRLAFLAFVFVPLTSSANEALFEPWCETFTAQGLVSLAANRIFGRPLDLSDAEYEARSEWVNNAYALAEQRFNSLTGETFASVDSNRGRNWLSRCQLADRVQ